MLMELIVQAYQCGEWLVPDIWDWYFVCPADSWLSTFNNLGGHHDQKLIKVHNSISYKIKEIGFSPKHISESHILLMYLWIVA